MSSFPCWEEKTGEHFTSEGKSFHFLEDMKSKGLKTYNTCEESDQMSLSSRASHTVGGSTMLCTMQCIMSDVFLLNQSTWDLR